MTRRRARIAVGLVIAFMAVEAVVGLWCDHLTLAAGGSDSYGFSAGIWLLFLGLLPVVAVGALIAVFQPHHPVGWLFLGLGVSLLGTGPIDGYANYANLAAPREAPGAAYAALLADREWVPWLVLPALILQLTPTGTYLSSRWRLVGRSMVGSAVALTVLAVVSDDPLDPPYHSIRSPLAIAGLPPPFEWLQRGCVLLMGLGALVSAASLVVRFRRSRDDERQRLLWLVVVAVPTPLFIVSAFVGSMTGNQVGTLLGTAGVVTLVPLATGLSVLRYRLYDVERIVASTITWVILTTILVTTYALVVWLGARAVPSGHLSPAVAATLGALVAAGLAFPLRHWLQDQADRRLNRRAYEGRRLVEAALATGDAAVDVESVLRAALADPRLTVAYPTDDGPWLRADGEVAAHGIHVDIERQQRVVARIGFDPSRNRAEAVRRVAVLAAAELDNTRLRAELARRLDEVDASRRRLAHAQQTERRRIERDLHDGAQQRLLALALELQSARLNGDPTRMQAALGEGAESAKRAVRELRDLANGLHPAALEDGGLAAALDDIARLSRLPVRVSSQVGRLDQALEFTAWTVIGEAVVNAQKHSGASAVDVDVTRQNGHLRLRVHDDGHGGANSEGPGLRGLRDRVETARGTLRVVSGTTGTTVEAVLPCES